MGQSAVVLSMGVVLLLRILLARHLDGIEVLVDVDNFILAKVAYISSLSYFGYLRNLRCYDLWDLLLEDMLFFGGLFEIGVCHSALVALFAEREVDVLAAEAEPISFSLLEWPFSLLRLLRKH